ncbi:MAG: SMC-Scp complex subunit ScpB [Treponema sp.]|nr:SMC-Scp complex subunit ScpB [Treponema sp.]
MDTETALIEAILFLESDTKDFTALSRISGLSRDVVKAAVDQLEAKYAKSDSGVELSRIGGGVMISAKREYWDTLREHYGRRSENRFSRAALETLSIIAYSQPVTRAEIEGMRGASPDAMIRFLLEKNLIREVGKKDIPGKPQQYGTTPNFLKVFRLESIADLPKLSEDNAERFELS